MKTQEQNTALQEKSTKSVKEEIRQGYREYILLHGQQPPSVFAFCGGLKIEETEFYEHYASFNQIAGEFWVENLKATIGEMSADPGYHEFTVRERMLNFYFIFFEKLKAHRSYVLVNLGKGRYFFNRENRNLSALRKEFKLWVMQLLSQGVRNGEVASRSRLSDLYDEAFWYQFLYLLDFWKNDESRNFEKTDAAIEKSVNFGFDLIEKNALDSALDFGKFMFQNR